MCGIARGRDFRLVWAWCGQRRGGRRRPRVRWDGADPGRSGAVDGDSGEGRGKADTAVEGVIFIEKLKCGGLLSENLIGSVWKTVRKYRKYAPKPA